MTPLNDQPGMGKNYILALVLSMLVLISYPFFLKMVSPPPAPFSASGERRTVASEPLTQAPALTEAEGPFFEPQEEPTVIPFESNLYQIEFSTFGGAITRLLYKGDEGRNELTRTLFYEGEINAPGLLGVRLLHQEADLTRTIFKLSRRDTYRNSIEFTYEKPGEYKLTKQFLLRDDAPLIEVALEIENLSPREKHFAFEIVSAINYEKKDKLEERFFESIVVADKIRTANVHKVSKKGFSVTENIQWSGLLKKYFALLVKPDWTPIANQAEADHDTMWSTLRMEPVSVPAGGVAERRIYVYAGPQRFETLEQSGMGFEAVLSKGFFGFFKVWLLRALKFCHRYTLNFGWAIIILTLLIKLAFTPLTHISYESMKKMQALQPKIKNLQERYKKDPTRMNKEMMGLYKRNRVNPMSGCLPMLLQIPVFIAFYQVLSEAIELKGAPWIWWIQDLSEPDRLMTFPFTLPMLGNGLNILPLLMIGSMYWQQKLTPQMGGSSEQMKIMSLMPFIFGFLFYGMPSGLVLYWFINNVLSIVHQVFIKRMVVVLHHEDSH